MLLIIVFVILPFGVGNQVKYREEELKKLNKNEK